MEQLHHEQADIAYVMPSHQFPMGTNHADETAYGASKMGSKDEDRYLIEDDHNSEFRYKRKTDSFFAGFRSE